MRKLFVMVALLSLAAGTVLASPFVPLHKGVVKQSASEPNRGMLDCSNAIEVTLDNVYYGDNTGLPDNVSTYGCSTWGETGGEVVYHLHLDTPTMFEVVLTTADCDLDLAVLDQCDEDLGCLVVADEGVTVSEPVAGDYYFVVDGYGGDSCPYTLTINTIEPVDFCDLVEDATIGDGDVYSGYTCDGQNLITSLNCGDYAEEGLEDYFEVVIPAGASFTATVTYDYEDGALWLLDGCTMPFTCLAYADETLDGDPEEISYTNTSGSDMVAYLVVDSFGEDACGAYTLEFQSTGGALANKVMSFGAVKALFR